ncbi:tRNA epoxyqueuosine(34) reductase QueG [Sphingomonas changnyeongensis]|uniref:Epoxyqueuosine reductase n=1 Tax=Sphingomonas changnyeongensis TaxID=2698679 RepID=A0A7Z2NVX3_9SPHN|nr:tRNA epoxyqueuosine(34) reductase QueG [Sphingomonas changnyeongensis]QHL90384.1 tRNA epoxyqueuosine(34) reductase QueG [Sphingomonas changnyeongensis]
MPGPPIPPTPQGSVEAALKAEARALGFAACGIARADAAPRAGERLRRWLAEGAHGEMIWMESRADQRAAPAGLWPEVRSVIALGLSYAPALDPLALADQAAVGRISVYAQGGDYHDVVKKKLKELARWLVGRAGGDVKVFVDTAPVMEKPLAEAAGLGWQGKHTNLVSRSDGSWLFLGMIFTTLDLAADAPGRDRCGSCDACQRACPTQAFPAPYRIDARRCVSYLTIEHKGPIPPDLRPGIGNRIYGCDDCLAVCPWNKFARSAAANLAFHPRAELTAPALADLLALDDRGFRQVFAGSPVKRIGRDRMVRNCLIAAGNGGDPALGDAVAALIDDPAPIVRGAAIWALARIDGSRLAALAPPRTDAEADPDVRAEWAAARGAVLAGLPA